MPAVLVKAHCYAELAVSSPAVAETIASTNRTYTRKDRVLVLEFLKLRHTRKKL